MFAIFTVGSYSINYNHDLLNKNMNADLTNPNVYNGIDSLKEEHVYDEIKHKEGYKDPGKTSDFHEIGQKQTITLLYMHITYIFPFAMHTFALYQ